MPSSPLDSRHRLLGAKMTPFGGWDMPLQYGSVLDEHRACRTDAAVFDVSHLGTIEMVGPDAFDRLQFALSNDLRKIAPGRAQYTHLLDVDDAHVVDDIIVWWLRDDSFLVMPNASNTARIVGALDGGGSTAAADVTTTRAVLAVQGPQARDRLRSVLPEAAAVGRFRVAELDWDGVPLVVAGTGYTGEDGVEIQVPSAHAEALWDLVVGTGVVPAGLGARDTLRLEAGLPLHGHELGPGITPLQAGLGWVIGWDKPDFRGRAALEKERAAGIERRLVGLAIEGRQPPRDGYPIESEGVTVGVVTSGNFSPTLGHGIALAFVSTALAADAPLDVVMRGRAVPAQRVSLPFVR